MLSNLSAAVTKVKCSLESVKTFLYTSLTSGDVKTRRLKYISIASVSGLCCVVYYLRTASRKKKQRALSVYFSDTYHEARSKFREASSLINIAKQHSLTIDSEADLSIDLTYIPGDVHSKHVMLHISGTHGAEGFAGSAIQISLLRNEIPRMLAPSSSSLSSTPAPAGQAQPPRPHILFVHALNAFGMAFNRRWNQANIDLNRNCIFNETVLDQCINRDHSSYAQLDAIINPARKPTRLADDIFVYFQALQNIAYHGYDAIRKAVVEGQYYKKQGLFFGGKQLAVEHQLLRQFLTYEMHDTFGVNLCQAADTLTLIDVHTGLGAYAVDALLMSSSDDDDDDTNDRMLQQLFPMYAQQQRIMSLSDKNTMFRELYKDSKGSVADTDGYGTLFSNAKQQTRVTQEFGTYDSVKNFVALRNENMAYHYSQGQSEADQQEFYHRGNVVKNIFYPQHDPYWKSQVLRSGTHVFEKLLWRR